MKREGSKAVLMSTSGQAMTHEGLEDEVLYEMKDPFVVVPVVL